jgi:hypothetical protein
MVEQTQYETVRGIKGIILSIYSPQADGTHTLKNVLLGVPTEDNPNDYRLAVVPERSTPNYARTLNPNESPSDAGNKIARHLQTLVPGIAHAGASGVARVKKIYMSGDGTGFNLDHKYALAEDITVINPVTLDLTPFTTKNNGNTISGWLSTQPYHNALEAWVEIGSPSALREPGAPRTHLTKTLNIEHLITGGHIPEGTDLNIADFSKLNIPEFTIAGAGITIIKDSERITEPHTGYTSYPVWIHLNR